MKNRTFILAFAIALVLTACYELFRREQGYFAYHEDNEALWADWRRSVDEIGENQVLMVGSSRLHFDIDIYEWEKQTGHRPAMLARVGTSPGPIIKDLAENTDFAGKLLVGVAPDLFFDLPTSGGWKRLQDWVDYTNDQTYAQKLNQFVFQQIDPHFAFVNDHIPLSVLIENAPLPSRDSVRPPVFWPDMTVNDENRNLKMRPDISERQDIAEAYKSIWAGWGWPEPDSTLRDTVIDMYLGYLQKISDRGGEVAFIRCPSTEDYLDYEYRAYPRKDYWDELIDRSGFSGIHFQDYSQLDHYSCPEWSHLNAEDARQFTRDVCTILTEQGFIKPKE